MSTDNTTMPPAIAAETGMESSTGVRSLVIAARALLDHGGTVVRRQALRSALESVEAEASLPISDGGWPFTPAVIRVLALARAYAQRGADSHIRIAHVDAAIRSVTQL